MKKKKQKQEMNIKQRFILYIAIAVIVGCAFGLLIGVEEGKKQANEELNAFCEYSNGMIDHINMNEKAPYNLPLIGKIDCTKYKIE